MLQVPLFVEQGGTAPAANAVGAGVPQVSYAAVQGSGDGGYAYQQPYGNMYDYDVYAAAGLWPQPTYQAPMAADVPMDAGSGYGGPVPTSLADGRP